MNETPFIPGARLKSFATIAQEQPATSMFCRVIGADDS
jgi:hypothetical protein